MLVLLKKSKKIPEISENYCFSVCKEAFPGGRYIEFNLISKEVETGM